MVQAMKTFQFEFSAGIWLDYLKIETDFLAFQVKSMNAVLWTRKELLVLQFMNTNSFL